MYGRNFDDNSKTFTIHPFITRAATNRIEVLLAKENLNRFNVMLVGIHCRRGDMAVRLPIKFLSFDTSYGFNVAEMEYYNKAMEHFRSKYMNGSRTRSFAYRSLRGNAKNPIFQK